MCGEVWEISALSAQFHRESKTLLKNKVYFKNPLKYHSSCVYFEGNPPPFCLNMTDYAPHSRLGFGDTEFACVLVVPHLLCKVLGDLASDLWSPLHFSIPEFQCSIAFPFSQPAWLIPASGPLNQLLL